tara:strand:+ start:110 stop:1180 length:1071 start_codon:yes stop_codon:yes gene_type:complete
MASFDGLVDGLRHRPGPVAATPRCAATIVNLGLPRSGTTSLHAALQSLGLRSRHPGSTDPAELSCHAAAALRMPPNAKTLDPDLTAALGASEAVGCMPWATLALTQPAALSAVRAPPIKLIASTRPLKTWVPSARWLFEDPLFKWGHPEPVLEVMRASFGGRWPSTEADFARGYLRHAAAVTALNVSLIDLREPAPARWRALCAVLLAPPACPTRTLRSMADCPVDSPWPLRSERHNDLEMLGLSGQQARTLGLMQADDREARIPVAAMDELQLSGLDDDATDGALLPAGDPGDKHPAAVEGSAAASADAPSPSVGAAPPHVSLHRASEAWDSLDSLPPVDPDVQLLGEGGDSISL